MPLHLSHNDKSDKFSYPSQELAVLRHVEGTWSKFSEFDCHSKSVTAVCCATKGDRVLSADEIGYVYLWNANHPELLVSWDFQGSTKPIHDMCFNQDSDKAAFVGECSAGKFGKTVSLNLKKTDQELSGHTGRALSCTMKGDRPFKLYTSGEDQSINVFGSPGFTLNTTINHHSAFVNCVRISPNNKLVVSCSSDKSLVILSVDGDLAVKVVTEAHSASIYSIAWFDDSTRFATCSADKTVKVWTAAGDLVSTLNVCGQPAVNDMQMGVVKVKDHLVSVSLSGALNIWKDGSIGKSSVDRPDMVVFGHNVGKSYAESSYRGQTTSE